MQFMGSVVCDPLLRSHARALLTDSVGTVGEGGREGGSTVEREKKTWSNDCCCFPTVLAGVCFGSPFHSSNSCMEACILLSFFLLPGKFLPFSPNEPQSVIKLLIKSSYKGNGKNKHQRQHCSRHGIDEFSMKQLVHYRFSQVLLRLPLVM